MILQLAERIKEKINRGLPGKEAHLIMSHRLRHYTPAAPQSAMESAVCILLYPDKDQNAKFVLMQRTSHNPNDKHKGQISLPGGKRDLTDKTLTETALRELHEEIGVTLESVNVVAQLSDLYIPVSNFKVYPFIAFSEAEPEFIKEEEEVQELIEIPLYELLKPDILQTTDIPISKDITLKKVPYFKLKDRVVWGATAMILSEFKEILKDIQLN